MRIDRHVQKRQLLTPQFSLAGLNARGLALLNIANTGISRRRRSVEDHRGQVAATLLAETVGGGLQSAGLLTNRAIICLRSRPSAMWFMAPARNRGAKWWL